MDPSNWRPTQGASAAIGGPTIDWRAQLQADSRQRIVNKIMNTLKRHLPFSGHEGLQELKKIALRFEEEIYTTATSQSDYLRKISLKMLTMETRSQNSMPDAMQSTSSANSVNPSDTGSHLNEKVNNQGLQLPISVPSNNIQQGQQIMSQSMHNNISSTGMQGSSGLSSALPPGSHMQQPTKANVAGQSLDLQSSQNLSSIQQNQQLIGEQCNSSETQLQQKRLRPTEGTSGVVGDPTVKSGDWRAQLQADSRERVKIKMMGTMKRCLPFSGHEELNKMVESLEEEIHTVATSQSDYLRKISLKMLTMENRSKNPM